MPIALTLNPPFLLKPKLATVLSPLLNLATQPQSPIPETAVNETSHLPPSLSQPLHSSRIWHLASYPQRAHASSVTIPTPTVTLTYVATRVTTVKKTDTETSYSTVPEKTMMGFSTMTTAYSTTTTATTAATDVLIDG
ncbi:hypothetical protein MKZ38_008943 [Zalerion maritima]|uniref:Uncharacterized protein n=1 Tax=Zalerion maritima TaxID=339359 RepID=A0AAD5WTQ3_9PEZI|nr:hypothetical protein MKZ38_008943 [Zalerion maritima]